MAVSYLRSLLRTCLINEVNYASLKVFVADVRETVGDIIINQLLLQPNPSSVPLIRLISSLFRVYMLLLIDLFAVERQISIFTPIHYGGTLEQSQSNMNISLKEYYFGDEAPSLFTSLFNKQISQIVQDGRKDDELERTLQQEVNSLQELVIPLSVERLVLLDKYVKAGKERVKSECESIATNLYTSCFKHEESDVSIRGLLYE